MTGRALDVSIGERDLVLRIALLANSRRQARFVFAVGTLTDAGRFRELPAEGGLDIPASAAPRVMNAVETLAREHSDALWAESIGERRTVVLCRLPLTLETAIAFRVQGDIRHDADDVRIDMGTLSGVGAWWELPLPPCPDCHHPLRWAEAGNVPGARECTHCRSLFLVTTDREVRHAH